MDGKTNVAKSLSATETGYWIAKAPVVTPTHLVKGSSLLPGCTQQTTTLQDTQRAGQSGGGRSDQADRGSARQLPRGEQLAERTNQTPLDATSSSGGNAEVDAAPQSSPPPAAV